MKSSLTQAHQAAVFGFTEMGNYDGTAKWYSNNLHKAIAALTVN